VNNSPDMEQEHTYKARELRSDRDKEQGQHTEERTREVQDEAAGCVNKLVPNIFGFLS